MKINGGYTMEIVKLEEGHLGGNLHQPHPGAQCHCYRCSLPGLAEFTANRRGGTNTGHHN